jgi:hypothetical protein
MKEIVRKIFGDEVANDEEIVEFYSNANLLAFEEFHTKEVFKTKNNKTEFIKGCYTCPFKEFEDIGGGNICKLDDKVEIKSDNKFQLVTPHNCPLKFKTYSFKFGIEDTKDKSLLDQFTEYTKEMLLDEDKVDKFLQDAGIHNENGELTERFGGKLK